MFLHVPVSYIHAGSELRQRALTTLEKKIEVRMLSLPVPWSPLAIHWPEVKQTPFFFAEFA